MSLLIPVTLEEIAAIEREPRRGRMSYPICKGFLESGLRIAILKKEDLPKPATHMKAVLDFYVRSHKLPIKLIASEGNLYFARLDLNADGTDNEWEPEEPLSPAQDLTPEMIAERFEKAKTSFNA